MVWVIVAHSEGELRGVISPELGPREVGKWCAEMADAGCTLQPCADEASYEALLDTLNANATRTRSVGGEFDKEPPSIQKVQA
jgi:hypothetical protein